MTRMQVRLAAALSTAFHFNVKLRCDFVAARLLSPSLTKRFLRGVAGLSVQQEADVRLWLAKHAPQVSKMLECGPGDVADSTSTADASPAAPSSCPIPVLEEPIVGSVPSDVHAFLGEGPEDE